MRMVENSPFGDSFHDLLDRISVDKIIENLSTLFSKYLRNTRSKPYIHNVKVLMDNILAFGMHLNKICPCAEQIFQLLDFPIRNVRRGDHVVRTEPCYPNRVSFVSLSSRLPEIVDFSCICGRSSRNGHQLPVYGPPVDPCAFHGNTPGHRASRASLAMGSPAPSVENRLIIGSVTP